MSADKLVETALILLLGGFILWKILEALVSSDPGFGKVVGGAILAAFMVGAVAKLKSS